MLVRAGVPFAPILRAVLPTAEHVLDAHAFVARRHRLTSRADGRAVRAALAEAATLAAGDLANEPVAVFYAFTRHRRAFGDGWRTMTVLLTQNQARPRRIDATAEEFHALMLATFHREFTFEDVRAWFVSRLR